MASLPLVAATLVVQASQRGQHPQEQVGGNASKLLQRVRGSHLLSQSRQCEDASVAMHRKRRRHTPQQDLDRRVVRAEGLVQMGELSAGRQALEGASLAPGNRQILDALQDPQRRPPVTQSQESSWIYS